MARKINNVMPKIQVANNIVLFPTTTSLKNVVTSSSNEKEEEWYKKKPDKKNQLTSIMFQSFLFIYNGNSNS
jgi:hypothetical protein